MFLFSDIKVLYNHTDFSFFFPNKKTNQKRKLKLGWKEKYFEVVLPLFFMWKTLACKNLFIKGKWKYFPKAVGLKFFCIESRENYITQHLNKISNLLE